MNHVGTFLFEHPRVIRVAVRHGVSRRELLRHERFSIAHRDQFDVRNVLNLQYVILGGFSAAHERNSEGGDFLHEGREIQMAGS